MHDAVGVGEIKRRRNVHRDANRLLQAQVRFPFEPGPKRLPFDVRHHIEQRALRSRARVVQRQNVGMEERRRDRNLLEKTIRSQRGRDIRMEQLYRHRTIVPQVTREKDPPRAATADLVLQLVAAREGLSHHPHRFDQPRSRGTGDWSPRAADVCHGHPLPPSLY
jgi:hypothetical protein